MTASSAGAALADETMSRWSALVVPWLVSRGALFAVAQRAADLRSKPGGLAAFRVWDGPWYADIARYGYDWAHPNGETPYPFFPLLPAVLRFGTALGFDPIAFGVIVNHLVFLIALAGVYEIARVHFGPLAAGLAVWSLALFPGSAPLTMVYPDVIFLACAVWAFRAIEEGRDARAGLLAAIAALARPNGLVVALALALALATALASRSWRRILAVAAPAVAAVAAWMAWLWTQTGDPLIFIHAKAAWHEITVASLLAGADPFPRRDLAPFAFAALVLALTWRRLPVAWLALAGLTLLPSLAFGILGMPRYTSACFPVFVAAGILLARLPVTLRVATLVCFAAALLALADNVFLLRFVP